MIDIVATVLITLAFVTVLQTYSPECFSSTELSITVLMYTVWETTIGDVAVMSLEPSGPIQNVLTDTGVVTLKKSELN